MQALENHCCTLATFRLETSRLVVELAASELHLVELEKLVGRCRRINAEDLTACNCHQIERLEASLMKERARRYSSAILRTVVAADSEVVLQWHFAAVSADCFPSLASFCYDIVSENVRPSLWRRLPGWWRWRRRCGQCSVGLAPGEGQRLVQFYCCRV